MKFLKAYSSKIFKSAKQFADFAVYSDLFFINCVLYILNFMHVTFVYEKKNK